MQNNNTVELTKDPLAIISGTKELIQLVLYSSSWQNRSAHRATQTQQLDLVGAFNLFEKSVRTEGTEGVIVPEGIVKRKGLALTRQGEGLQWNECAVKSCETCCAGGSPPRSGANILYQEPLKPPREALAGKDEA